MLYAGAHVRRLMQLGLKNLLLGAWSAGFVVKQWVVDSGCIMLAETINVGNRERADVHVRGRVGRR